MTRVKRGTTKAKTRRKILKMAKGYRYGLSTKKRQAKTAITHAAMHAFNDRRKKKGNFRKLWQIKISAKTKELGLSYSKFIGLLNKKEIKLNRKTLAEIAEQNPKSFKRIVNQIKT